MEKFKIEVTKDEMIKYYANKIIEKGLYESWEGNISINLNEFGELAKYKDEIFNCISNDERVADIDYDIDGEFDIIFYTDYLKNEYEKEI